MANDEKFHRVLQMIDWHVLTAKQVSTPKMDRKCVDGSIVAEDHQADATTCDRNYGQFIEAGWKNVPHSIRVSAHMYRRLDKLSAFVEFLGRKVLLLTRESRVVREGTLLDFRKTETNKDSLIVNFTVGQSCNRKLSSAEILTERDFNSSRCWVGISKKLWSCPISRNRFLLKEWVSEKELMSGSGRFFTFCDSSKGVFEITCGKLLAIDPFAPHEKGLTVGNAANGKWFWRRFPERKQERLQELIIWHESTVVEDADDVSNTVNNEYCSPLNVNRNSFTRLRHIMSDGDSSCAKRDSRCYREIDGAWTDASVCSSEFVKGANLEMGLRRTLTHFLAVDPNSTHWIDVQLPDGYVSHVRESQCRFFYGFGFFDQQAFFDDSLFPGGSQKLILLPDRRHFGDCCASPVNSASGIHSPSSANDSHDASHSPSSANGSHDASHSPSSSNGSFAGSDVREVPCRFRWRGVMPCVDGQEEMFVTGFGCGAAEHLQLTERLLDGVGGLRGESISNCSVNYKLHHMTGKVVAARFVRRWKDFAVDWDLIGNGGGDAAWEFLAFMDDTEWNN